MLSAHTRIRPCPYPHRIQWGILVTGFFHLLFHGHLGDSKVPLHLTQLVEGDFAAATALISLGAVLGTTSPSQTLVMVTFELVFYALNFQLGVTGLKAADIGGTMMIHTFGACTSVTSISLCAVVSLRHVTMDSFCVPLSGWRAFGWLVLSISTHRLRPCFLLDYGQPGPEGPQGQR